MRPVALLAVAGCISWLVGCRSQQPLIIENYAQANKLVAQYVRHYDAQSSVPWLGPPGTATHLHRRHAGAEAVLRGQIQMLLTTGQEEPLPGALIIVDGKIVASVDQAGRYAVALTPGRHQVQAGTINFLKSKTLFLQVERGDSICLNVRLLQDLRPILCQ